MPHETPAFDWTVRPARLADLPGAARLAAELVRLHHRYDPLRFMLIEPIEEGYEHFLRTQIDREDVVFMVAVTAGNGRDAVIGYAFASLEERDWSDLRDACGKIHDVYVDESARGHGVATRLVGETIARLGAKGAPRVVLMAAWQNDGARELFAKLG